MCVCRKGCGACREFRYVKDTERTIRQDAEDFSISVGAEGDRDSCQFCTIDGMSLWARSDFYSSSDAGGRIHHGGAQSGGSLY